jgi:hypothetical protein
MIDVKKQMIRLTDGLRVMQIDASKPRWTDGSKPR